MKPVSYDTINIVLKNNSSQPCSLHPHGVLSTKSSEGAANVAGRK